MHKQNQTHRVDGIATRQERKFLKALKSQKPVAVYHTSITGHSEAITLGDVATVMVEMGVENPLGVVWNATAPMTRVARFGWHSRPKHFTRGSVTEVKASALGEAWPSRPEWTSLSTLLANHESALVIGWGFWGDGVISVGPLKALWADDRKWMRLVNQYSKEEALDMIGDAKLRYITTPQPWNWPGNVHEFLY